MTRTLIVRLGPPAVALVASLAAVLAPGRGTTRSGHAQVPVCTITGTLAASATWTPACVYKVLGAAALNKHLTIPAGVTLTIEPGTIVKFERYDARIDVYGTLIASGTPSLPILFTSLQDGTGGTTAWGNINIPAGATAGRIELDRVNFRYGNGVAKASSTAVLNLRNIDFYAVGGNPIELRNVSGSVGFTNHNGERRHAAGCACRRLGW